MSGPPWALRTKLGSSRRALHTVNQISPAQHELSYSKIQSVHGVCWEDFIRTRPACDTIETGLGEMGDCSLQEGMSSVCSHCPVGWSGMSGLRCFLLTSNPNRWTGNRGPSGSSIPLVLGIPILTVLLDVGFRVTFKINPSKEHPNRV